VTKFSRISKVAVFLLVLALPALAAGPTIIVNPLTPSVILAANGCGTFDVSVAPESGKPNGGREILFANVAIFHGPTFATLTNVSTGKSISLNISGPSKFYFTNNIFVNEGLTLLSGVPANLTPPNLQGGLLITKGRLVSQFDHSGNLISVSLTGTARGLCSLLE
jgi:hypothetical protein